MSYGAALVYSGRDSENRDTLYRYLVHRAYGLSFKESAEMTRPEALFIPTGRGGGGCQGSNGFGLGLPVV
jgi:dynein light intermediate chain 1